jgi:hypothetical protein
MILSSPRQGGKGRSLIHLLDKIRVIAQQEIPEAIVFGPTSSVEDIKNVLEH